MSRTFTSSKPDPWAMPRPHTDPSLRLHTYGKIRPMAEHKQARLGAGLGLLAAVAGAGLIFTLANVLADNGLSPFGPSQQVVSSASPLPSLSQEARP